VNDRLQQLFRMLLAPWEWIIGEGHIRTDKDIAFDRDAIPDLNSTLDRDTVADLYLVFDEHGIADITILAQRCAGENMSKRPYACMRPNGGAGFYDCFFVDENGTIHKLFVDGS
jgi:hypothetical protein